MTSRKTYLSRWVVSCVFAASLGVTNLAQAASVSFSDAGAFQMAVGGTNFSTDFSGFSVDTPLRGAPVDLGAFTLQQTSGTNTFRNTIDVAPFLFGDNNGTPHASLFVEGDTMVEVTLAFAPGVTGFGGTFIGTSGGEMVSLRLVTSSGGPEIFDISGTVDTTNFFGVVADPGATILSATLFASTANGTPGGEGFTLDDVIARVGAAPAPMPAPMPAVPEPASIGLLGLGVLGLLARRRRLS